MAALSDRLCRDRGTCFARLLMRRSSCLLLVFAASCTCGREISGSACDSSNPCVQSTFNQAAGKCVDSPVTDGTSCDAGLGCLVNTRCAAGTCVGEARSC